MLATAAAPKATPLRRRRAFRAAAWLSALPAFALFVAPGVIGVRAAARPAVSYVVYLTPYVLAVGASIAAAARARDAERRFWGLLALAFAMILADEAYATYLILALPAPMRPTPLVAVLSVGGGLAFLVLLVSMTRLRLRAPLARFRFLVDALMVAGLAFLVSLTVLVEPLFEGLSSARLDRLLAAAYPVTAVVLLGGTLTNLVGLKAAKWKSWERVVAAGIATYALGVALWPVWYVLNLNGAPARTAVESLWFAGQHLIFVGAVYRLTASDEPWGIRPVPQPRPATAPWSTFPLYAVSFLAVGAFSYRVHVAGSGTTLGTGQAELAIAGLGALLVTRSALVAAENRSLAGEAGVDPVTGLANHRRFHDVLGVELAVAKRYMEPLSVIVLDLDAFGSVNDLLGHPRGDAVLRQAAEALVGAAPQGGCVCRIGGDEFGLVLPETSPTSALAVAEELRAALAAVGCEAVPCLRASIGVAAFPEHAEAAGELVRLADGAQYWAKLHGKDRVVLYDRSSVAAIDAEERIRLLQREHLVGTMSALAAAVDARDPGARYHSRNVARLVVKLGRESGLPAERLHLLEAAAMLHDVGKIGVRDAVLRKAGPLRDAERRHVQEHPLLAERILSATPLAEIVPWIVAHHERWDGMGYPYGLAGERIPLEARILAVCDAFDAMVSDRPYRSALSVSAAVLEIDLNMGAQFDPVLAERFIRMVPEDTSGGRSVSA